MSSCFYLSLVKRADIDTTLHTKRTLPAFGAATCGALADVNGEDVGEQDGPGESMSALLW